MIQFFRACRLAVAVALSLPIVTAAQAGEAVATDAPRVVGTFAVPAIPASSPTASFALPIARAPVTAAPGAPTSLNELVAGFSAASELDQAGLCLAKAVYFEARGESLEGQLAVAKVVLNRAASGVYPSDVCAVVTQKSQFSFIRRGQFPRPNESSESWRKAVAIAHIARNGLARSVPENVLWYHANYVSPSWGRRLTQVTRIGTHIFYS